MGSTRQDIGGPLGRLLADDEELIWHARPRWRSLVVQYLASGIPVLIFVGPFVFMAFLFVVFAVAAVTDSLAVFLGGFLASAVATLAVIYGLVYLAAKRTYAHAEYAATDHRLIAFGGVLGRDYSSVSWDAVQDLQVDVGWLDSRYGTGTIEAIAAGSGSGVQFDYVAAPYDVLDRLDDAARRGGR